ncbi:cation-translocating P-type ATPase [uncultured Azohydromonas sp.]|jgi:Cd2+/Zn2+-exporting ATPase|uniref:heavy metal translocating P-type ATPase n=1 Tax=uncultured Azohydromonas sp. TaxID=487342 RepID=UPI0026075F1B|nr:heavy metal translocating P-type ATPase [uncultured Azohydromonas sp.]
MKPQDSTSSCSGGACCGAAPAASATVIAVPRPTPRAGTTVYRIPTMDCPVEEAEIRRALEGVSGIHALSFQLGARTLAITAPAQVLPRALEAITGAGFNPQPLQPPSEDSAPAKEEHHGHDAPSGLPRLALALALALLAEGIELFAPHTLAFEATGMALALAAIALSGLETYAKGFAALRRGRLTINALMSVAVTGAFLIGQWPEAAMVMALYGIAELVEARAADRARDAIRTLMALAPEEADVRQADGAWRVVAAAVVAVGDTVRIRPGERVPLDGVVTRGSSALNQAPVTGESIPVDKAPGDVVFAGSVNQTGEIELRVTAPASGSTLARIIHAVEQAQSARAPTQRFVDRFSQVYTPAIFALALATAVLLPWLTGATWTQGLYKALVLLVIGCPCALVISTPVTVVSALAAAARRGVLVKGGTYLEQAREIKTVALDKTGTLTEGRPKLVHWESLQGERDANARVAASLAARSDHPVSQAIAQGLALRGNSVTAFKALAGRGVEGVVEGRRVVLGNHRLAEERGQCSAALEQRLQAQEAQGRSLTLLMGDDGVLAVFAVADTIKAGSREAVAQLRALGVTPVLLTGDNAATGQTIARQAGIGEVRANLLPEDKLAAVEALRRRGAVAMVGDGINDAPALARADIGIAMGAAGTDTAMEAADVVVMNDDLRRIPETIRLSRLTRAVLWQNITFAIGVKAVFFVLAVFGSATMWMAVFADMGATLIVVANGLRLLRAGPAERADDGARRAASGSLA